MSVHLQADSAVDIPHCEGIMQRHVVRTQPECCSPLRMAHRRMQCLHSSQQRRRSLALAVEGSSRWQLPRPLSVQSPRTS